MDVVSFFIIMIEIKYSGVNVGRLASFLGHLGVDFI